MFKYLPLLLVISFPSISNAQLKPLETIILENADNEVFAASYSSKRCAAIYLEVAKIVQEMEPASLKPLVDKASELTLYAALIDSGKTAEKISTTEIERTDKEVKRIWKILSEISDDSYARTGVYLSPHTKDMELCRALYPLEDKLF